MPSYNYYVTADNGDKARDTRYNGDQAADAMAAWSKAVTDGVEYVVIQALRTAE